MYADKDIKNFKNINLRDGKFIPGPSLLLTSIPGDGFLLRLYSRGRATQMMCKAKTFEAIAECIPEDFEMVYSNPEKISIVFEQNDRYYIGRMNKDEKN